MTKSLSQGCASPSGGASPPGAPQARALSRRRNSRPAGPRGAVTSDTPAVHAPSWRRDAGSPASHTDANGVEMTTSGKPEGQPWVFVVSRSKQPMGLVHPAVARIWRRKGKARMHRVGLNVIRITCRHAEACFVRKSRATQADIGNDPGAKTSGLTLAIDWKVVWMAEIHHRSGIITKNMTGRRQCRSSRRCRRKRNAERGAKEARWRHRSKKAGWLPPSVYHRVQAMRRWIR